MRQQLLLSVPIYGHMPHKRLKRQKDTCLRRVELQPVGTLARRAWGVSICTFVLVKPVK